MVYVNQTFRLFASFIVFFSLAVGTQSSFAAEKVSGASLIPSWVYDRGPDPNDPMGAELIELFEHIPSYPAVSMSLMGKQKFRPFYGPVGWRMVLKPNSVKILFIGQDATHIAEAANRTATAGFGGRAQDLAEYLGVHQGAAFINTFAYTIQGQYGTFDTPYVFGTGDEEEIKYSGFVDPYLWSMTHDLRSPIVQWRNSLIDWIMRNNRDSLEMIVLFGGAARDSIATFIKSRGGDVEPRFASGENVSVPLQKIVSSGGNNEISVPVDSKGGDVYESLLGRKPDYKKTEDQQAAREALEKAGAENLVFAQAGPGKNGLITPSQLGGYDLNTITINGKTTRSLKGLLLSDNTKITKNVEVVEMPHPTALSKMDKEEASQKVGGALELVADQARQIQPDPGLENKFAAGKPYAYSRAEISSIYYDFGTPKSRMVAVSSASRMPGKPHVIVFGTRDKVEFDPKSIKEMTDAQPAEPIDSSVSRAVFDPGPPKQYALMMKQILDLKAIFAPKRGKSWEKNGIAAFNVKTHADHADFGHYRGTFENPKVLILADPDGVDDLITSRALTGARGQYLHGLMRDLGVGDQYLVIKTVPFGMTDATPAEWKKVLSQTKTYRDEIIQRLLEEHDFDLILTDGTYAKQEMARILEEQEVNDVPVVNIAKRGYGNNFGIEKAGQEILGLKLFEGTKITGEMANIPKSHLTYGSRATPDREWEGTSGDRVLEANDSNRGLAVAEVAPAWQWKREWVLDQKSQASVGKINRSLVRAGFPKPGESVPEFLARREQQKSKAASKVEEIKTSKKKRTKRCRDDLELAS